MNAHAQQNIEKNSIGRFVDVTQADGTIVVEPLVRSESFSPEIARQNVKRMAAILESERLQDGCVIYFPAGKYHFDGALPGKQASIESTRSKMTFKGDAMNGTYICQGSREVSATFRIVDDGCTIEDLAITSSDYGTEFEPEWDANPHDIAIHLDAPGDNWYTDPQILNVSINTTGNNINLGDYYRPFKTGVKITGPWLNVYIQTMWIREVFNAFYVNQGALIAGPAKIIDVNAYASPPTHSKTWNIFFKSEGHFMEQVELIHCTYIGSQFIYMDGTKASPGTNPVYNMIIDHNYINNNWLDSDGSAEQSGIYLNLPPLPDKSNYSRDIRFTNNSCSARAPRWGAFFYVEGSLKGLTFVDNDIASGGGDKCIYVRATQPVGPEDLAVRDIKITSNEFRNFRNPITIGGDLNDPSRVSDEPGEWPQGKHDDPHWIGRVSIVGNHTHSESPVDKEHLTTFFLNRCRKVSIGNNGLFPTDGIAIALNECHDIAITGNNLGGDIKNQGVCGVWLKDCTNVSVVANTLTLFKEAVSAAECTNIAVQGNSLNASPLGIRLEACKGFSLQGNTLRDCQQGLLLKDLADGTLNGNQISESQLAARFDSVRRTALVGNFFSGTRPVEMTGDLRDLLIESNIGLE